MPCVRLRVPAALRELCAGQAVVVLDVPRQPSTVGDLLDVLAAVHPALERRVRDERGRPRRHVNVFVGDANVRDLDGLGTALPEGCEVFIVPAVSGG
jgi:sulfur-carrier protein